MTTFHASRRSDKSRVPETRQYQFLTIEECKSLRGHCDVVDKNGKIANVKITSVKTWKTRRDVLVGWKFGLYEYGSELITTDENRFFVKKI